jgi:hypothetical protein
MFDPRLILIILPKYYTLDFQVLIIELYHIELSCSDQNNNEFSKGQVE